MKPFFSIFLVAALQLLPLRTLEASPWSLPVILTEKNATISFEVDSTWHTVEGTVQSLSGELLPKESDTSGVPTGWVEFSVEAMNTGNSMRDSKMRRVMHADQHPKVRLKIEHVNLCGTDENDIAARIVTSPGCQGSASGVLTISGVSKPTTFLFSVTRNEDHFIVDGGFSLRWADYGVEDPSILVAHLDDTVKVKFQVTLDKSTQGDLN